MVATDATAPKVLFKLNTTEDAPTILRFVTNYLAVEPTAQVAAVGYAGGNANGKPYADQLAAWTAPDVQNCPRVFANARTGASPQRRLVNVPLAEMVKSLHRFTWEI